MKMHEVSSRYTASCTDSSLVCGEFQILEVDFSLELDKKRWVLNEDRYKFFRCK